MKLTPEQYFEIVYAVDHNPDFESFAADVAHNRVFGYPKGAELPEELTEILVAVWNAGIMSVKEIAAAAGISLRRLSFIFGIPRRTSEDWSSGDNAAPTYTLLMIQECLGIYTLRRELFPNT